MQSNDSATDAVVVRRHLARDSGWRESEYVPGKTLATRMIEPDIPSARGAWVAAGALAVVFYLITLRGGFVYDDREVVRDDARVSEPGR